MLSGEWDLKDLYFRTKLFQRLGKKGDVGVIYVPVEGCCYYFCNFQFRFYLTTWLYVLYEIEQYWLGILEYGLLK